MSRTETAIELRTLTGRIANERTPFAAATAAFDRAVALITVFERYEGYSSTVSAAYTAAARAFSERESIHRAYNS
jgi:hypothetical protein